MRSYSQKDLLQSPTDKDLSQNTGITSNTLMTPLAADRAKTRDKPKSFLSEELTSKFSLKKKAVNDLIPLSRVQEFRDVLVEAKDEEFDDLPAE